MAKNIKTSLIVATYNWPEALRIVLKSIARQVILPDEVIIADDGSTDETRILIESLQDDYPCLLIHVWQEDDGFRAGQIRNKALAKATGDYIIQIDGDIIIDKYFVADHLEIAEKGYWVAGSRIRMGESLTKKVLKEETLDISFFSSDKKDRMNGLRNNFLRNYYKHRYKIHLPFKVKGCNISYWRKDAIAVNGYNEDITGWGAEDLEFIVKLVNSGIKRQSLKLGGVAHHLYHNYRSREKEIFNLKNFYQKAIDQKIVFSENGLNKYL